jgi:hypothetical protein
MLNGCANRHGERSDSLPDWMRFGRERRDDRLATCSFGHSWCHCRGRMHRLYRRPGPVTPGRTRPAMVSSCTKGDRSSRCGGAHEHSACNSGRPCNCLSACRRGYPKACTERDGVRRYAAHRTYPAAKKATTAASMTWGTSRASERALRTERIQRVRDKDANANNYKKCCNNLEHGHSYGIAQ